MKNLNVYSLLKRGKITAIALTGVITMMTSGCGNKNNDSNENFEVITEVTEEVEEQTSVTEFNEETVAPFIYDNKVLQCVVLQNGVDTKILMGYFYETDGWLYVHEIFNNGYDYNLSYMQQSASEIELYTTDAANLLTVSSILNQSITKEEYEMFCETAYIYASKSWGYVTIGYEKTSLTLHPKNIDLSILESTTFTEEKTLTK